jgi:hypothetical protein
VRVATKTTNLKIEVSGVQGVTKLRRRLSRAFVSKHALVPRFAREPISFLASFLGAFSRSRLMRGCIPTMMIGDRVETIFGFEREDDALQWIKEKSQSWMIERR